MTNSTFDGDHAFSQEIVEALVDERRRTIVRHLANEPSGESSVDALTDALADLNGEDPTSVEINLYHVDLPKLSESGIVEFDPRTKTARYDGSKSVERFLDAVDPPDELQDAEK